MDREEYCRMSGVGDRYQVTRRVVVDLWMRERNIKAELSVSGAVVADLGPSSGTPVVRTKIAARAWRSRRLGRADNLLPSARSVMSQTAHERHRGQ